MEFNKNSFELFLKTQFMMQTIGGVTAEKSFKKISAPLPVRAELLSNVHSTILILVVACSSLIKLMENPPP